MPTPAIKICGINTVQALEAALKARAEFVGLNFVPASPRFVALSIASTLAARAKGQTTRVGLFVDADDATIGEAVLAADLDVIQLHGNETPERAAQVGARFARPVWKVISVASADDVSRAERYGGAADFLLFDSRTPKGALPGGMGLAFDWKLLAQRRSGVPWGLAGGLNAENVGEAVRLTGAPLVDTSSGVESAPGTKDAAKIAAFCRAARAG